MLKEEYLLWWCNSIGDKMRLMYSYDHYPTEHEMSTCFTKYNVDAADRFCKVEKIYKMQ